MAQSAEYPDLKWVPPKSWTNANRSSVQLIVIHTTQGSYHGQSAEDGAAYDARRTDGVSTHYFHDDNSTVQCVRTEDKAHHARTQGNNRGIGHELCGRAEWDTEWSNTYATAMLKRAAKQAARDAVKWGIPVKHLTVAQVDAGDKGFCGHYDITRAFPEDGGTHTDPGPDFPWSRFLDMVRAEMGELPMEQSDFNRLMDGWAGTTNGKKALERAALADVVDRLHPSGVPVSEGNPDDANPQMGVNNALYYLSRDLWGVKNDLADLRNVITPPPAS